MESSPERLAAAWRTVRAYLLGLASVAVLLGLLHLLFADVEVGGVSWFDLDKERNLGTWFSGALFLLFGLAALAAYAAESRHNAVRPVFRLPELWLGVAAVGLYMSLDEITILHENLFWREIRVESAERGGAWQYLTQWQLVFAPAIVAAVVYFALFFTNRFVASRRARVGAAAGLGCWFAALALEGIRGTLRDSGGIYGLEVLAEELLEMGGSLCLLGAVASYVLDIGLGLDAERRRRLELGARFLTPRALRTIAAGCGVLLVSASLMVVFARRQAAAGAPLPALFRQALAGRAEVRDAPAAAEVWFDDIGGGVRLPAIDDATLARFLSARLLARESSAEAFPPELAEDEQPRIVFLSLSDGRGPGRVVRGFAFGLGTALARAAEAAGEGWERGWVRIDIVDRVDGEDRVDVRPPLPMDRGIHGLAFARASGIAFGPGEVMAYDLVNDRLEIKPHTMLEHLKTRDTEAAARFAQMLEPRTATPFRFFSTRSFFLSGGIWIPLFRGHRTFPDLDRQGLLEAARRGGEYLVRSVLPDGRFVYSYDPGTGEMSSGYNMLRHAGTAYAMLELYRETKDVALANAARTAISYLRRNVAPCRFGGQEYSCVRDDDEIKLGGNALGVIALVEYERATGDRTHRGLARDLARWIQAVQSADGEFVVHKQVAGEDEPADFESAYYPGEALLALVRLYELERDESLLDSAERGARWLIEVRDGRKFTAQLDHDHWLLYALNELQRRRPAPRHVDHAAKIAEAIYVSQLRAPRFRDWTGGWSEPPRSTPAAVRAEGLAAAWALARDYGRRDRLPTIVESIRMSVRFELQTQIGPEQALYFPDPQRALGGFHRSLTRYEIRNDYVQHNISALLGLARILEQS